MKAVTDFHKFSGSFARSALALAIGALLPLAIYAQAGNPPEPGQEKNGEVVPLADAGEPAEAVAVPAKPNPPAPAGSFRWTGVYVGGHFGYNWARANTSITPLPTAVQFVNLRPTALDLDPRGVFGGGQIGFNWQIRNTVLGVEFDISKSNFKRTVTVTPIIQNNGTPFPGAGFLTAHQNTTWFGTLRERFGVAVFPRVLIYGTVGSSFGHENFSADTDFRPVGTAHYPAAFSKTKRGWSAGVGTEFARDHHWSVRADYLFYDLGSEAFTADPASPLPPFQVAYRWNTRGVQTLSGGVNYRF